ncbi:MAG: hypothetical protein ACFFB9_14820 [Promethearchaeota archaeon]
MMFVPVFRYVYLYSIPYHYFVLAWIGSPIILVGGLISAIIRHTIFK